jgi:hypothetical protein
MNNRDKNAVKKYGLLLCEITELKIWFCKHQDFEMAAFYRDMERSIEGKKVNKRPEGTWDVVKFMVFTKSLWLDSQINLGWDNP